MAASSNDKISQTANGGIPVAATVQATRASGVNTLSVDTQQYWPTGTGVKFSTFKVDTNNKRIAGTQADWKGVSNGSNALSNIVLVGGLTTDPGNAIGDKVVMGPTAQWGEDVMEALLLEHKQLTGAHGNTTHDSITNAGNYSQTGGTFSVPNNSINAAALATNSILLGYAQITANFTTASTTSVQVTGLTSTVTVPPGGRRVKISFFCDYLYNSTASSQSIVEIWDGTVGTGTLLSRGIAFAAAANNGSIASVFALPPAPAAGSKTYNIGLKSNPNTAGIEASATYPAYIMVELV